MGRDIRRLGRDARPVPYSALTAWQTTRRARIDNLVELYRLTCGLATASHAEQVLWALVLRLAAEFQGFTRDLHDEAVTEAVRRAKVGSHPAALLFVRSMTSKRNIDRMNARSATLSADVNRLGLAFWPELGEHFHSSDDWRTSLDSLNTCRNAIAHDRQPALVDLARRGWTMDLSTVHRWLNSLDELASAMDYLVETAVGLIAGGLDMRGVDHGRTADRR